MTRMCVRYLAPVLPARPFFSALRRLIAVAALGAAAAAQEPGIVAVAPSSVQPNGQVAVRIRLTGAGGLTALLFDLTYDDTAMVLTGIDAAAGLAATGMLATNPEVFPSATGRIRCGFLKSTGLTGDGLFAQLTFVLDPDATGPLQFAIENAEAVGAGLQALTVGSRSGHAQVLAAAVAIPDGWSLFALPAEPTDPDPAAVFGETPAALELAAWDPGTARTGPAYVVYDGTNIALRPGNGYWSWRDTPTELRLVAGTPVRGDVPFWIELAGGWNLLGNPFAEALLWDPDHFRVLGPEDEDLGTLTEAAANGLVLDYVWVWDGVLYRAVGGLVGGTARQPVAASRIDSGTGFWFFAHQEGLRLVLNATRIGSR